MAVGQNWDMDVFTSVEMDVADGGVTDLCQKRDNAAELAQMLTTQVGIFIDHLQLLPSPPVLLTPSTGFRSEHASLPKYGGDRESENL